ncbi:MAG: hypothetical protein MMC23_007408 [Stictis urceolatum]|nr:hypothetical protein [Stictis urceolata]
MPPTRPSIYPSRPPLQAFPSRRSVVHSTRGIISCTQPLAARCGQRVLDAGGNAADAAVAVAAGLNVTEPCNTGIGGDMFCLFYSASEKKVRALNGSGRAAAAISAEELRTQLGVGQEGEMPFRGALSVTVPGAAAGWVDCVEKFGSGKVGLEDVLRPAVELAEEGYPVSELCAYHWGVSEGLIKGASPNGREMLAVDERAEGGCRAPRPGEVWGSEGLARTFRELGKEGKKGFYEGEVAEEIVKVLRGLGAHLSLQDLKEHGEMGTEETEPISLVFKGQGVAEGSGDGKSGIELWEHPPNGQGLVALIALGILEELERDGKIPAFAQRDHNSPEYIHAITEALRIAFADGNWWIADPSVSEVPAKDLISREYLKERAKLFDPKKAQKQFSHGSPAQQSSDTVYFSVTDSEGNGISFINSNYAGFGSAIVPEGFGFTLQNRGANFVLQDGHPNVYAPRKRPYHTIIPAMITNPEDGSLHSVYGVMGGFMQPQGHLQVLLNMLTFKLTPQVALDAPRICTGPGMPDASSEESRGQMLYLEEGIAEETAQKLRNMGHRVDIVTGHARGLFGRGQVIRCHKENGKIVYSAGSDPRGDGAAIPV